MTIYDILDNLVVKKLKEIEKKGYIAGGHNGPYYDTDTHVRNTAHWVVIFSYYYKKTGEEIYYRAVEKCGEYLLGKEARPMGATFFCRYNTHKDFANGTIGQAWAIEGLVAAYEIIGNRELIEVAKEVFLLLPFDENYKLWKVINVDGSQRGFDMTFNHQLWFAASGALILTVIQDSEISRRCKVFFNNLENLTRIHNKGLIKHSIVTNLSKRDKLINIVKWGLNLYKKLTTNSDMYYKENGYHLFNIYAFALIKDSGFNLDFFNSKIFRKSLNYCFDDELYEWLENKSINYDSNYMPNVKNTEINIYGFSYNAPGFELPYIYKVFQEYLDVDKKAFVKKVVQKQIDFTYDKSLSSFSLNTEDTNTLEARIYEFVRSLD